MSDIGGEGAIRMPPLSFAAIEALATAFLSELAPETLEDPIPLDVASLIDHVLPQRGIHINPASAGELNGNEGLTNPGGDRDIEILIDSRQFDAVAEGGRRAHRGRSTTTHEVGHAILHVPVIRGRRKSPVGECLLRRVKEGLLKPYEHPEWQAWAFAGCLLMPRRTVQVSSIRTVDGLARHYGVSEQLAQHHLRRLKMV